MNGENIKRIPVLPLRDIVLFPHMVSPLFVGRAKSVQAIEDAMAGSHEIFLSAQKDARVEDPKENDIYKIGTLATILQILRLPDGTVKVLVEGKQRARIKQFTPTKEYFVVDIDFLPHGKESGPEVDANVRLTLSAFEEYIKFEKKIPSEVAFSITSITDNVRLADTLSAHLPLKVSDKQQILETISLGKRFELIYKIIFKEIQIIETEKKVKERVKKQLEKNQKDYYLNEQIKAIQKEIGQKEDSFNELAELEKQIKRKKLPKEAAAKIRHELKKLKQMPPLSAEATVVRNYIDWILSLPWMEKTSDSYNIKEAEKILEEDHFGLEKPKERILEYLAVQGLTKKLKGPILCLAGPPGVGKTSLAKSVARALGRNFVRVSLGGVRDEAEIRGHRRTYIGSMPGKIIQSMKKAKTINPVICLDEIDKMTHDFRGDPSSALLEVLDPEQNFSFNDHYLDLDYDLSKVLFLTTANSLHTIPAPLLDRMEVIELPGYTEDEKQEIAKGFLVSKQIEQHGLKPENIEFSDKVILNIIRNYTREAGVRNLERTLATICRKIAKEIITEKDLELQYKPKSADIPKYLGAPKYRQAKSIEKDQTGVANGLAWTETGGTMLKIEATIMPGKGNLLITGKLGDVMQESVQAAMSYIRSRSNILKLPWDFYQKIDVHLHVPEGATPKDGPSAGITIATAIVSALLKIPVRHDIAMTGEITLSGRVLPIGGLKEKLLAARRAGIKDVIIPDENKLDLREIPQKITKNLNIIPVENVDIVLKTALRLETPEDFLAFCDNINAFDWLNAPAEQPKQKEEIRTH
jgi:ATP-dependent Lon protease